MTQAAEASLPGLPAGPGPGFSEARDSVAPPAGCRLSMPTACHSRRVGFEVSAPRPAVLYGQAITSMMMSDAL